MRLDNLFLESRKAHDHIGVFIQLPSKLGKEFPSLEKDDSPAHITVLYLGNQSSSKEETIAKAARNVANNIEPFEIKYGGLHYFHHKDKNESVAYTRVYSSYLRKLREKLVKEMKNNKIKWIDSWGAFRPHITLAYLNHGDKYDGKVPNGKFKCSEISVWGFKNKHKMKLNGAS